MRHINLAVEEMFSAAHMQLLATCCKLDKMLLASLLLELRAKGGASPPKHATGSRDVQATVWMTITSKKHRSWP